jgi:hypothetical protein
MLLVGEVFGNLLIEVLVLVLCQIKRDLNCQVWVFHALQNCCHVLRLIQQELTLAYSDKVRLCHIAAIDLSQLRNHLPSKLLGDDNLLSDVIGVLEEV